MFRIRGRWGSVVGIATRLWVWRSGVRILIRAVLFSIKYSRPAVGPTQSSVQWILELFQGGKLSGREFNHYLLLPRLRMSGAVFRLSRFYFYSRQPLCLWLPVILFNNHSHNL